MTRKKMHTRLSQGPCEQGGARLDHRWAASRTVQNARSSSQSYGNFLLSNYPGAYVGCADKVYRICHSRPRVRVPPMCKSFGHRPVQKDCRTSTKETDGREKESTEFRGKAIPYSSIPLHRGQCRVARCYYYCKLTKVRSISSSPNISTMLRHLVILVL
jgi:hypothetical protein